MPVESVEEREVVQNSYFWIGQKSRLLKEGITKKLQNTLFIGGVVLTNRQETPEENREKLRQEELKKSEWCIKRWI